MQEFREIIEHGALPVVLVCSGPPDGLVLDAWHAGAADILLLPLTAQSLDSSLRRAAKQLPPHKIELAGRVQARFFYLDDSGKECWASITPPRFTLGRSSSNDLALSQMGISRFHAEVRIKDNEYHLRDLGSKLGTYLNGTRIEEAKLTSGDRVQLGGPEGFGLAFHEGDLLHSLLGASDSKSEISLSVRGFKEIGMVLAAFRALSSIPLLDDLLALVVDTAIELTGAERGFIMLKEEDGSLSFRCARNNHKCPLDGSCFQTSHRVPHEVFNTGQPVAIRDLDVGDGFDSHSSTRQLGLRSLACVPLHYVTVRETDSPSVLDRTDTIGVLYVDSQNIGTRLSASRIDALKTLASEAAMAVYNARLFKDSQDKHRMEEQLAVAREIQQALLPKSVRNLSYVCAHSENICCQEVGGDYFDYFALDGGRFGFALGDVAGKGMPAALLASLVQGILSAQTYFNVPLPAMISNINQNLSRRGTGNRFVTFFFGILDPEGNCSYVNAGHNPPYLLRRDGSLDELAAGGMVLGLFPSAPYETDTIKMQPSDHLVLFTDGVVEALNSAGEEFGKERLEGFLKANARAGAGEILVRLRQTVLAFSANTPQHDDITMMVLGYQESGKPPAD
jgi:serine phosphatase RsbU (regulator of sigma subunit)